MRRLIPPLALALLAAACGSTTDGATDGPTDGTVIEDYPDANVREYERRANAQRPVEASALPPRHLDTDTFPEALVDRELIVSGGPRPDGIPSIDDPQFVAIDEIDWLEDQEAVLVLELGPTSEDSEPEVRIYPVQILMWHEIVNDQVGDRPVTVSYCPLCNSGVAFDRRISSAGGEELVLDFGTSGSLFQSAMVMYDRQTESLWTHFDARAVVGELVGTELEPIPLAITAWADAIDAHPDARVLERPQGTGRDYGTNPYSSYDQSDGPLGGFFTGDVDDRLEPMQRVTGVELDGSTTAVTLDRLTTDGVVAIEVGGARLSLWHEPGLASSLQSFQVAGGRDIGAVAAFVTDESFERSTDGFVDAETQSVWNVFGRAISGERAGEQLEAVANIDTFWFAWSTYHPNTSVID